MDTTLLKDCLGDELYAQVTEKLKGADGLRIIATGDGSWLPKSRLDAEIAKRNELKKTVEELTEKARAGEDLRLENEKLQRETAELRREAEIREAINAAHARDARVVERMIDRERLEEKGVNEQIGELRERYPYLFGAVRGGFGGVKLGAETPAARGDMNDAIRAAAGRY